MFNNKRIKELEEEVSSLRGKYYDLEQKMSFIENNTYLNPYSYERVPLYVVVQKILKHFDWKIKKQTEDFIIED